MLGQIPNSPKAIRFAVCTTRPRFSTSRLSESAVNIRACLYFLPSVSIFEHQDTSANDIFTVQGKSIEISFISSEQTWSAAYPICNHGIESSLSINQQSAQKKDLHVGIVGAGIGGLATAIAMRRAGARVTVLESAEQLGEVCISVRLKFSRLDS